MRDVEIVGWGAVYFIMDMTLMFLINYFFGLEINAFNIILIATIFSTLLMFLLAFDFHEIILNKILHKRSDAIVNNDEEDNIWDSQEEFDDFFAKEKDSVEVNDEEGINAKHIN